MSMPDVLTHGLYGPSGWLDTSGVRRILEPFMSTRGGEYARFNMVGAREADALLGLLPDDNLKDRQNAGPSVECALRAAVDNPEEVSLCGYVICEPRPDERVSIDALVIGHSLPEGVTRIWPYLRDRYSLDCLEPDECERIMLREPMGNLAWWLWWD